MPSQGDDGAEYDNEWAVQVIGGEVEARKIARSLGYTYAGPVRGFDDTYVFQAKDRRRTKRSAEKLTSKLRSNHRVRRTAAQTIVKPRLYHMGCMQLGGRIEARKFMVLWAEQQRIKKRLKRTSKSDHLFNDPLWPAQWQLHDSRNKSGDMKTDMNVIGAWKLGYTGKGVVVTILDPKASYDLNDDDPDPMPTFDDLNKHGTRCAGEIVMAPNNSFCGVGVAYGASIGGVRMLDGKITDRVEGEALSFNHDHIDIYSASWGPNDDGKTVEGPGRLAQAAILKGIRQGRKGKGAIYVWASGNGGLKDDDCDCDGYTDSVFTFSVSSAAEDGSFPWYGEKCASTLTSTYSTGTNNRRMIMTTDIGNKCARDHSGTSASAPMAAGIIALALEANPSLTWRDVQHIAVWTAEPAPLLHNNDGSISDTNGAIINFRTDGCEGQTNEINYLEHLQLVLDIAYPVRGHLSIYLVSPQGTVTQLLKVRREDKSPNGFRHWPFMSVHTWGENPKGLWQLEVYDKSGRITGINGLINNITLIIYGTIDKPAHYKKPRKYDMHYNEVTDHRRSIDVHFCILLFQENTNLWLGRVKRMIKEKELLLEHPERVDNALRFLDALNQRHKRNTTIQAHYISTFISR
ncbi:unnamed protein product [Anisakis simplex]|uniref:Neuroendocrine convertase 1 (inferred by orthology to a human protein) n=1 Tax=Anisakis simplex TaxID=6269 RepID=A0A0M3JZP1_ANISI|nr:unnamed protein product [Anisakis simplex]